MVQGEPAPPECAGDKTAAGGAWHAWPAAAFHRNEVTVPPDDFRERVTLLEARMDRLQRNQDSDVVHLGAELRQLRQRVEQQVDALDRRLARLERNEPGT